MEQNRSGSLTALATLVAPMAWGTTYITVTELLPKDRPFFVAACRVIPAGVLLLTAGAIAHRDERKERNWKHLCLLALFNFGLFFPLLIAAIYRLPGGVAASVGGVQPLLVALVGWLLVSIKPKRIDILIAIVAAIGVSLVVIRPGASIDPIGVVAAIGANLSFSIGVVLTKKFKVAGNRLSTTGIQLLLSALVIAPLAAAVEGDPPSINSRNAVGIVYLSLIATGAAFVIWFNGIAKLPAQAPPLLGLAAPVTGAVLGWIVLDQSLSAVQITGFGLTIGSIMYAATLGSAVVPRPD